MPTSGAPDAPSLQSLEQKLFHPLFDPAGRERRHQRLVRNLALNPGRPFGDSGVSVDPVPQVLRRHVSAPGKSLLLPSFPKENGVGDYFAEFIDDTTDKVYPFTGKSRAGIRLSLPSFDGRSDVVQDLTVVGLNAQRFLPVHSVGLVDPYPVSQFHDAFFPADHLPRQ